MHPKVQKCITQKMGQLRFLKLFSAFLYSLFLCISKSDPHDNPFPTIAYVKDPSLIQNYVVFSINPQSAQKLLANRLIILLASYCSILKFNSNFILVKTLVICSSCLNHSFSNCNATFTGYHT